MKQVAIILSIYRNDRIAFVKAAIDSLLTQSFRDWDLYVYQDGPVDDEVALYLTSLRSEQIHLHGDTVNRGLAEAMNSLLKIVLPMGYRYIARMDADDICMPTRLEKQVAYMQAHPEVDCVGTWAIEITADGQEYYRKQMPVTHDECLQLFHKRDCMIHPTVMFRDSYFTKAGLYSTDTYFGEDTMMWASGFASGCVMANIPEYLYRFRLDDEFFTRRRGWKHARSIFTLRVRVNRMLHFGPVAYLYALLYAVAKMMPTSILNMLYKTIR